MKMISTLSFLVSLSLEIDKVRALQCLHGPLYGMLSSTFILVESRNLENVLCIPILPFHGSCKTHICIYISFNLVSCSTHLQANRNIGRGTFSDTFALLYAKLWTSSLWARQKCVWEGILPAHFSSELWIVNTFSTPLGSSKVRVRGNHCRRELKRNYLLQSLEWFYQDLRVSSSLFRSLW